MSNEVVLIHDARLLMIRPNGDCVYRALPSNNVQRLFADGGRPYWVEEYNTIWTLAR